MTDMPMTEALLGRQIRRHENIARLAQEQVELLRGELLQLQNPGTTQVCPDCGSTNLIKIATQQQKLCTCGAVIPWYLDKGQESLL